MATRPASPLNSGETAVETLEATSPRELRSTLSRQVLSRELAPTAFPERYAAGIDSWLAGRLQAATKGHSRGYALLAVGGYGRSELAPASDLDLVLLHRARPNYHKVAEALWYAIWDGGLRLDHSVRTRGEAISMARSDLKVMLGLLDGRLVAGDGAVANRLLDAIPELWRKQAPGFFPELEAASLTRYKSAGELAFLLEPDLKLSRGGLRDLAIVRALAAASPMIDTVIDLAALNAAGDLIIGARVVLHCRTGSGSDRLLLQEQDEVAEILGFADADALMAAMAEAGRTIASASDTAWRRVHLEGRNDSAQLELPLAPGIVLRGGEVALAKEADPGAKPSLMLELARSAAERDALIERESLDRLERDAVAPPSPWDERTREAFIGLLATGDALVPVVEALDQRHLFELVLPEWRVVRNKPQRNAYHRFTVDRHLLETVARASEHVSQVQRPDLLIMGALLHDIGKGYPGDHSEVGKELAAKIAIRMGFPESDVTTIVHLVAYHLVLPEVATRRDLDDPSTATLVAKLVENQCALELLAALTEADSKATGPAAWGPWKAELVATLVDRVTRLLSGESLPEPRPIALSSEQVELVAAGELALRGVGRRVTVVAPDRPGLLAAVTGALALHGCNVRRATASPAGARMAIEVFDVEPAFDRLPPWDQVENDVVAALENRLNLDDRLAEHDRTYLRGQRPSAAQPPQAQVIVDNETSALASIAEVRAPDRLGLLHAITAAFARLGLDVVSALVDTLGHEVIDTFYVRDRAGAKLEPGLPTEQMRSELEAAIERIR